MIFKTITDDITGANTSITLLGSSLNDFKGIINSFKQNGIRNTFVNAFNQSKIVNAFKQKGIGNTLFHTPLIHIDTAAIDRYNNAINSCVPFEKALAQARKTTNAATLALIESSDGLEIQTDKVTAVQEASTLAAKAQSFAFKALSVAGNMVAFTLIVKGIQAVSKAIAQSVNPSKYIMEAMDHAQQSIKDTQNNLKNISGTIAENKDRFLELSEGVSRFSQNIRLSEEDYAEYLSISNKLAEISPSLISGYTDQGDALLYIGANAEETSEKLNQILEAEKTLAQQNMIANMDDVANGIYYQVKSAEGRIATLQYELDHSSKNNASLEYLHNLIKDVNENTKMISLGVETGLAFEEIQKLKEAIKNSGARIVDHPTFDNMEFYAGDYELVQAAIEKFYAQISYTRRNEAAAYINGLKKDILEQENTIRGAYSQITSNLSAWAKNTYEYDFVGEAQQNLIEALIPNLDWKAIKAETGAAFSSAAEYEQYIRENILTPLMSIPDEYQNEVNEKFAHLLEFKIDDIHLVDFASELEEYLNDLGITIDLTPLISDSKELRECYEQITNDAAFRFIENGSKNYALLDAERKTLDDFAIQNSINTRDEIAFWNQCLEESETAEEAMQKYLTSPPTVPLSISEAVDRIDTRLRPALSSLQSAYQEIFSFDENTGEKIFTPLNEADVTDKFKPVLNALQDLDEIDGINIDYSAYDDFVSVLCDTASEGEDVQKQFNKLAAYIINVSDCTDMSAESFNLLAESLAEMGVTNAYEVLNDILDLQESLANESINVETAMSGEAEALRNLTFASDETAEQLMAYYVQKQIAENPISTLNDILQLENLCNALGVTGEMYETVIALKNAISAKESGAHASGLDESIEAYQEKLSELAAGYGTFNFDFDGANTRSSSSSGQGASGSTPDTFDWTTTAIDHVEKEIEELDEVANSAYSTFSQKNEALAQEIGKISEEIDLQQQAYANYRNRAEAVGLSDHYKNLIQNGSLGMEDITDEALQNQISEYKKWYDKAQETQDKINNLYQKSNDLHVTSYENCVKELETLRDSQAISEREYLDRMNVLWEKYYANQIEYAVQAKEAKLKLLDAEKDYLESVANAAADILGEQADELKNRQESEIELLEAKKKPLEDQLELLEEQKDKEDRILSLQKAQYELKRAESQRSKLTYVDGQMQYRADETNIRDAKDAVDDAEYNIVKADIQDRINAYDKEIAKINERYEAEIANIERLENEWQNALALQERAQNSVNFESMFGEGSIAKLLAGDLSMVNTWKQAYLHTLGAIDMVSSGAIGEITTGYAELAGLDLSNIADQTSAVASQFSSANDAVNRLSTSLGLEPANGTANGTSPAQAQTEGNSPSLAGALQNTYDIASEVLPEEVKMMNAITEATNTAIAAINELKSTIESLSTVSTNISGMPIYGNAYASGTRRAERGLALVGEEKPEVILTNDKKAFLAKQPTLLSMEGGETVFNGDATARMLKARGFRQITADEFPLLKAFSSYSPDELRQKFAPSLSSPATSAASSAMQNASHAVNNSSVNNSPSYTTGDVHIHCPGITKDEVAKQIGAELTNVFSGLSLKAYQRANITR
ncbi:MAG: hypothetical protein HDR21_00885 [Lachnospiraceae bacterium]|nr:hypothetical protein [Lachnospiraceae bacterium]